MPIVTFVGNCQAEMLSLIYRQQVASIRGETVNYVKAYENADAGALAEIDAADLVAFQITDTDQKVLLPAAKRVVLFPHVTAFWLWPYAHGTHPRDTDIPVGYRRPFTDGYGDSWLDRQIAAGTDLTTLAQRYRDLDVAKVANLSRLAELGMAAQHARDATCGTRFGDYIMDRLKAEPVFIHPHHPTEGLVRAMVAEIFARMDCTTKEIEAALPTCRHPAVADAELPIHPRVAEHFGVEWAAPERKYGFAFGERVTWDQWCARYVAHDWGRELQDALIQANQPNLSDSDLMAAAMRLEAVAAPYTSGEALFALSKMRERLGDIAGAIEAGNAALVSAPYMWYYQNDLALLLARAGRHDESLALAVDAVTWVPHLWPPHMTLAMIHEHRRDREAMRRELRAVLAIFPDHIEAAARLARG